MWTKEARARAGLGNALLLSLALAVGAAGCGKGSVDRSAPPAPDERPPATSAKIEGGDKARAVEESPSKLAFDLEPEREQGGASAGRMPSAAMPMDPPKRLDHAPSPSTDQLVEGPGAGAQVKVVDQVDGPIAPLIASEMRKAGAAGRRLVVYVGATWCEPCKRFHEAVEAGELNDVFPNLRLLEFDYDRDEVRLSEAGYASKMLPLFAVPKPDGSSTGRHIEGSVKGDGAVDNIVPRLKRLLGM